MSIDPCVRLRQQLQTLATELSQDQQTLRRLQNTPGTPRGVIEEWAQVVALKAEEVRQVRQDLLLNGCMGPVQPQHPTIVFTELGPASILNAAGKIVGTGAVVDVAAHPTDSSVIFAATAGGGVWRTRNAT